MASRIPPGQVSRKKSQYGPTCVGKGLAGGGGTSTPGGPKSNAAPGGLLEPSPQTWQALSDVKLVRVKKQ